jgi:hypothetical protein
MANLKPDNSVDSLATQLPAPATPDTPDITSEPIVVATHVVATQLLATVAVAGGLALLIIGVVNNWNGMRTTAVTTAVSASQGLGGLGRLNTLWPSTAEARAGCQVLGGVPTWSPRGLSIFTPEGGWCGYMKAEGAWHLYGSHYGSTVKHSFPGRELPDPIQR